jgi:RNA polymerase subunit RPABC4/transcription elongation factor Spt4
MTRLCKKCGFVNQDDYDFCAKCGTPLVEGLKRKNFVVFRPEDVKINKKAILISYIITIFFSWIGVLVAILSNNTKAGVFAFFGFFMPFYLVQSKHPTIRKHGIIQLIISLVGVALSFYLMTH